MNKHCFKKVFSHHSGTLVAVGEQVRNRGKQPGEGGESVSGYGSGHGGVTIVSSLTGLSFALALASPSTAFAQALPTGGQVVGGSANIGQTGNTMTIDQSTQRAAINWNTFNIGADNTVRFNQPNPQSITLNRVVGGVPSNIQGSLLANGQVWIQNANGVLFGKNATINVNSLLATTKNVDVAQFMGGGSLDLTSTGKDAGIVNDGSITAQGYVTLVGDQARNNGAINAKQVTLAAGDSATVALDNGQGISVKLTGDSAHALAENTGNINAGADGSVLITAQGAKTVISSVINLDGVVRAGSVTADAKNGDITVAGKIDASNANADGSGGKISLTAMDGKLNAESTATLDASAGNNGNGGAIYVNSADTHFQGTARATGGTQSGDGGLIETSGEKLDITDAKIDASAANGQAGTWLLDPVDLTIDTPAANNISNALGGGTNVTLQTTATSATSSAGGGTTSTGDGNININAVIDWNAATTLTLNAWHDVNINAPITVRNSGGGVTINTRQDGVGTDFERSLNFGLSDTGFAGALNYTAGSGGHLSIDGITYTLVYSFADLRTRLSLSSAGNDILALASNLNASGTTYASPLRSSFGGTLEGLGHTINGLSINSADGRVGLFGDFMGIVRNLGLTNVSISGNSVRAGGLAGSNSGGSIINTYVSGTVNGEGIVGGLVGDNQLGGVIKNAYAYVSVNSSGNANITNVGGLVGYQADGLISDVHANVTVSGVVGGAGTAMANIGGLIGSQDGGSITNAHVAGKASGTELYSRIGGLVGYQGTGGSITASDADVSVSGGDNSSIGGLLGAQYGTIADAHASGAVNGGNDSSVGGLVGAVYLGSITNAYATGAVTRGNNGATGGLVGAQNDGILSNVHASGDVSGGDGGWIGGLIGSQFGTVTGAYATGTVSGGNGNIIGGLIGQQSGSVSNAYASGAVSTADNSWVGGLFGAVYYGGTSTDVHASGTVIGGDGSSVGGLIGWQEDGSVINAYATGAVSGGNGANIGGLVGYQNSGGSLANAHATGAVGGGNGSWIGGLVGVQYGSVSGSYATGTVSGGIGSTVGGLTGQNSGVLSNAYATGAVSVGSGGYAGGLIGEVYDGGTTTNVFATGAVRGGADADVGGLIGQLNDDGTVTNAYATGAVSISSGGYVGGLIGRLTTGTLTNTYFDTNTTGQAASNGVGKSANASGVTGRTTAQLQSGGTSIFNDPASWSGGVSGLYPYLTSFFPNGVQAVSGTAYVDSTETAAAASNASGAVTIRLDAHGNSLGQATTGANGYYYIFIPAGTLKQSDGLVVYGANAAGYAESATGASGVAAANLNLDGGWLTMKTGLSSLSSVNTGYAAAVANDGLYQPATAGITSERITATNATGFTIDNTATMTGNVEISAAGDLTIASGAQVLAGNDAILQTPGAFINNRGSDAVDAIGRWLIYSNNPDDNVFGNLNSGNTAIWNTAPGASVSANANRYVFAVPATISVTTTDDSKVYGDTTTAKGLANDYAIGGAAITGIAGAFVGDTSITISGAPTITSDGADAAATVAGGPYAINAAQGSLANSSGYAFTFANTGKLTVTPANLTVTPLAITGDTTSVTYNGTLQTNTFTPVGLLNSDTITSVDGLASGTNIGTYLDNLSNAQGTGLANYNITYANGSLTSTPATLTITGDTSSKTYTASAQTNTFTTTGLRGSDTVTSVNGLGNGTNVGTYDDSLSGATGSGLTNYNINYVNGSLTITPASVTLTPLAITGDTTSVTYNGGLQTNTFTSVGLLGTDAITGVDGLASGTNVGTYLDNLSNAQGTGLANYNITYANGSLT
ncbi:MAG: filamentous hemagglutinin N-terminal domain-containing protein, partial [Methylobacillus sp.]|nr:filamentous hemagglutinin N-terminal domain-containing protein [Methylobacillus sp.]